MSNPIIVLIVFAFGGILLGALVMYLILDAVRGQRDAKKPTHTQPIPRPADPVVPDVVATKSNPESEFNIDVDGKREKIFSIWQSSEDHTMQVFMDGQWHINLETMDNNQHTRFEKIFLESANWLGYQLAEDKVESDSFVTQSAQDVSTKFDDKNSTIQPLVEPVVRQKSIVEQVDDILQEILAEKGFTSKNIRLTEMPNKGVIVWTGKDFYESIDSVPDEEVKGLIKSAVKRWEETSTR